jgi:phosphohistidine phosphatase
MKTLFLLRHAKAVPASNGLKDFDRSLNDQGRRQAERIGKYLKDQNIVLDLVLSSTALRARETTDLVMTASECLAEVGYDQRIYEAGRQQLIGVISEIGEDRSGVLLVGHNPGIEELSQHLTDRFSPMATATLAKIDLEILEWTEVTGQRGQLDWLVKSDELGG